MFDNTALSQSSILVPKEGVKPRARSTLVGRNVVVSGHRTSVRLEPEMWDGLREICRREHSSLHKICTSVSLHKVEESSLTASVRVFVMRYYRDAATEEGHGKAGHGFEPAFGMGRNGLHHYTRQPTAVLTKTSFL